ncbi:polyamine transporter subunit; membrane component of ABC superfamily [Candidatus Desulfarcum epimagneticum]|uniref:Polyamine transporter subunit membrane component of ABC superfamily n=1 Tax=uncultured Desulfobacteraceae bacterium TaxID=218296 RepID=A0A484HNT2_9BACT|nr:polyamine transporter subunit; membrane component of ABC superfamily [uncultured Desulfobacteraceae bacterium]
MPKDRHLQKPAKTAAPAAGKNKWKLLGFQMGPLSLWLIFFLIIPILVILYYSFCQRNPGGTIHHVFSLKNYIHFLGTPVYRKILIQSFVIAFNVTLFCLLTAYVPAYYIATLKSRNRVLLLILLIVPFWTSLLIRNYSWILILGREGIINVYFMKWGLISEPMNMLYTTASVVVGLTHWALPFMVFPIFLTIDGIDPDLAAAAKNLGANSFQAFLRITFPLSMPGVAAGCLLTFIMTIGAFVTPVLLGGSEDVMITMVITERFLRLYDLPFGSAASIIYLIIMLTFVLIYDRLIGLKRIMNM